MALVRRLGCLIPVFRVEGQECSFLISELCLFLRCFNQFFIKAGDLTQHITSFQLEINDRFHYS